MTYGYIKMATATTQKHILTYSAKKSNENFQLGRLNITGQSVHTSDRLGFVNKKGV